MIKSKLFLVMLMIVIMVCAMIPANTSAKVSIPENGGLTIIEVRVWQPPSESWVPLTPGMTLNSNTWTCFIAKVQNSNTQEIHFKFGLVSPQQAWSPGGSLFAGKTGWSSFTQPIKFAAGTVTLNFVLMAKDGTIIDSKSISVNVS